MFDFESLDELEKDEVARRPSLGEEEPLAVEDAVREKVLLGMGPLPSEPAPENSQAGIAICTAEADVGAASGAIDGCAATTDSARPPPSEGAAASDAASLPPSQSTRGIVTASGGVRLPQMQPKTLRVEAPPREGGAGQRAKALILFDWDDTLCPTSWIEERRTSFDAQKHSRKGLSWDMLAEQARAVSLLVQTALSFGPVALVTLAQRPWVDVSVREFMPEVGAEVTGLDVFYAREPSMLGAGPGVCPWTAMKRRAMQQAMGALAAKLGQNTTWESLVSVGDSDVEKRAAQDLGRECQARGTVKWTKTVKLMEHPGVKQLTKQVLALNRCLADIVEYPGHRHVSGADWAR